MIVKKIPTPKIDMINISFGVCISSFRLVETMVVFRTDVVDIVGVIAVLLGLPVRTIYKSAKVQSSNIFINFIFN